MPGSGRGPGWPGRVKRQWRSRRLRSSCAAGRGARRRLDARSTSALMVLIGSSTATAAKFAVRELPGGAPAAGPVRRGGALPAADRLAGGAFRRMIRRRRLAAAGGGGPLRADQPGVLPERDAAGPDDSHIGLIYAACPLVVLVLAAALGQERLAERAGSAGVLASVAGVVVIGAGERLAGRRRRGRDGPPGRPPGGRRRDVLGGVPDGRTSRWSPGTGRCRPWRRRSWSAPCSTCRSPLPTLPAWPPLASVSPSAWRGLALPDAGRERRCGLTFQNLALRRLDASQVATVGNLVAAADDPLGRPALRASAV